MSKNGKPPSTERLLERIRQLEADLSAQRERNQGVARQEEMLAALSRAERRRYEFLSALSHELRNPLSPIISSLFILERVPPGSDPARRAIEVIKRQAEHLTAMVDDLLDFSRISLDRIKLQRERINVVDVVRRMAAQQRPAMEAAGLRFEVHLPSTPILLEADAERIGQAVEHLLDNTVKFTPAGTRVRLSLQREGHEAVLRVEDDGPGISDELMPRLFEPFVDSDLVSGQGRRGLGLGLALVKGFIEAHGGSVHAQHNKAGHGAIFTLRLPLLGGDQEEAGATGANQQGARQRKVLLIEDSPEQATSLATALEILGHRVEIARDGKAGIAAAHRTRPDVVLCDVSLPGMSGYDVARALRSDPALPGVKLIAITGYALTEDRERALLSGFHYYIVKPPDMELLERLLGD